LPRSAVRLADHPERLPFLLLPFFAFSASPMLGLGWCERARGRLGLVSVPPALARCHKRNCFRTRPRRGTTAQTLGRSISAHGTQTKTSWRHAPRALCNRVTCMKVNPPFGDRELARANSAPSSASRARRRNTAMRSDHYCRATKFLRIPLACLPVLLTLRCIYQDAQSVCPAAMLWIIFCATAELALIYVRAAGRDRLPRNIRTRHAI